MKHIKLKSLCVVVFLLTPNALLSAADNPIYTELVDQGIAVANGKTVTLPKPVMADGLTAKAQQEVLKQVGPSNKGNFERFLRGRPNDWYEDKQSSEKGANPQDSTGRRIDLYFIAQGKLETVASQGFVKEQINQGKNQAKAAEEDSQDADAKKDGKKEQPKAEKSKIDFYTPEELKARKLAEKNDDNFKERYVHGIVNLVDKVQVTGSAHAIESITPDSITIAFKIDRRFDKDPTYPNIYQLIKDIVAGKPVLGDAKPYFGFGAYAKITRLQKADKNDPDKIFVEYHVLYDEPYEWFNGTTELVSKLDISYKDNISKFRRNILEFQKNQVPANKPDEKPAEKTEPQSTDKKK